MNFFFIYFSLARMFCLYFAPPPPHKFSNGPSLNQNWYGTYLVHIKFRVLKCHSLDIRIETFHGSLIRQWEVNSIHQLFFSVVCQLLSKHILATFCDNDVARSCNYFLNTNCDTLLFYFFFVIILVSLRQTLRVGHQKYRLALFHEAKFLRTV